MRDSSRGQGKHVSRPLPGEHGQGQGRAGVGLRRRDRLSTAGIG